MGIDELLNSGLEVIEENFAKFEKDPASVDPSWRELFQNIDGGSVITAPPEVDRSAPSDLRIYYLIQAYRRWGHLLANINPLATSEQERPWQLKLENLGFSSEELQDSFPTNGLLKEPKAPLEKIIAALDEIYCENIGVEYMGFDDPALERWLQERIEPNRFKVDLTIEQKKSILQHLNKSELFEVFLHTKYVGQKRFSLEGSETLIPIIAAIIETGVDLGITEHVLGMAHRGRLNVLSNIMDKSYKQIFTEFEEGYIPLSFEGSGDVKYHKGFSAKLDVKGKEVLINLCPNPSHLESVDPVVEGMVKAKQVKQGTQDTVLPILVHGDAAVSGQGVVYETLQMYDLEGYSTGGTVHIVINNQIGFTTLPQDGRSTRYCTDIAKAFNAPVFHVNAEDPEACVFATILAVQMRQLFHCDVFIDLNCYRKYGHNEGDEPAFTQPHEYNQIRQKKPIRELYRDNLINQGVLERQMAEALEKDFREGLQKSQEEAKKPDPKQPKPKFEALTSDLTIFDPVKTGVKHKTLLELAKKLCTVPDGFSLHKKLKRLVDDRLKMAKGEIPVDWGMGETLAYATLLNEGKSVRISGQDSCRGTFSHRHALWKDQEKQVAYIPLSEVGSERFDVYNSPLSEYGVLGFEYGYSLNNSDDLIVWEAQFGDFANGAQIIIDQYISTGEMKWGQKTGLTMLLPHGYEGQGPEHSSGRMERFLTLCGNDNMLVVDPTTPAQLFHLLRRQVVKPMQKPLIIFTPKGLLRYPKCVNEIEDFTKGSFQEIIDDPNPAKKVKKIIFCTGRIYYDLIEENIKDAAIVRVEQLYPVSEHQLEAIIKKYKGFENVYWVQEEPKNMGAWNFIRHRLRRILPENKAPIYVGRDRSASPAAGSFALHKFEHESFMQALRG